MLPFTLTEKRALYVTDKEVGGRLKLIEAAFDKSGVQMAELLGCDDNSWSKYKKGDTPLPYRHALKLREVFGVSTDWIFAGGSGELNTVRFKETLAAYEARDKSAMRPKRGRPPKGSK